MSAKVLVVCTANVCRSPMAAGLLASHLRAAGHSVIVTSAGTQSVRLGVDRVAVDELRERGIDISGHQPRAFDGAMLEAEGADLIITMTRAHLRVVATTAQTAWPRTFTFRELVRRASAVAATASWSSWLTALNADRSSKDLIGDSDRDDIADPYGAGAAAIHRTVTELEQLTRQLVALAPWPD